MDDLIEKLENIFTIFQLLEPHERDFFQDDIIQIRSNIETLEQAITKIPLSQSKMQQLCRENKKIKTICKKLFPYFWALNNDDTHTISTL